MRCEIKEIFGAIRDSGPIFMVSDITNQAAFNLGELPCQEFDSLVDKVLSRLEAYGLAVRKGDTIWLA